MPWIDDLPAEKAESLSDELKTNPTLAQYNSIEDILNGHIKTKSMVGSSIRIPGPDAPEEDRKTFYDKLINNAPDLMLKPNLDEPEQADEFFRMAGRPDEATKYTKPEGVSIDESVENELRNVLFEAGLTDRQYQKVIKRFGEAESQRVEMETNQREEQQAELKSKWGMVVEERIDAARKINEEYYPGRDFASVSPKEIESLYAIHTSMTGKGPQVALQEANTGGMTPEEAMERGEEMMRKAHDRTNDLTDQERSDLVRKRIKLLQKFGPAQYREAS